ncbi:MAG: DUF5829 family protein [Aquaticitalea sp.]
MKNVFTMAMSQAVVIFLIAVHQEKGYSQELPPVFLNHVYLVLDQQTYQDIHNSDFMINDFGFFEERTTNSNNGKSWSGIYFYGKQTYIEFFMEGISPQFNKGESAIGFGVEVAGSLDIYNSRLKEIFGDRVDKELVTKKLNNEDIPWFFASGVDYGDEQTFFDWLMEYEKNYLKNVYTNLKVEEDGISRQQNLSRMFDSKRLFKNIKEVTIALDQKERERLIQELEVFNYKIVGKKNKMVAIGPEIKFYIIDNARGNGIKKLKIELNRRISQKRTLKFGSASVLTLQGRTAFWTF